MTATGSEFAQLKIARGTCYALFVYDIALAIDLEKVDARIAQAKPRRKIRHGRRSPKHFEYHPQPLRITEEGEPLVIGAYRTQPAVDLILYDFGAVTVLYSIALEGPLASLLDLSVNLYDNDLLVADSRSRVERILGLIREMVQRPNIADITEDYVVFHIQFLQQPDQVQALIGEHAQEIAQILRAEAQALSADEVQDALGGRISYSTRDLTIVDWNAALVVDSEGDDVFAVLEFANVELLEMRHLDRSLDEALGRAYEVLARSKWSSVFSSDGEDMRRIGQLQVDSALLFEGVNNALKLLGDQYLARVYRLVSQRFHLAEWDEGILRKLQTLESIYEKISDRVSTRRLELLEWIIILLISISIVLPFLLGSEH
ncbi:MAG TPA: hypothetical protein VNL14_06030 [Candidatus Acidoferrales bacterium]|nr:hypothetical protein [Candidatus Acidoferrales bacterium]